jgi:ATP-binding cassette subfamily B multidrug efflux pump
MSAQAASTAREIEDVGASDAQDVGAGDAPPGSRPASKAPTRALRRTLRYLRPYWLATLGALVALCLVSAANLLIPQLIHLAIDQGITAGRGRALWLATFGLAAVALIRALFTFAQGYLAERASHHVAYDLRDALFARIEALSFSYHDRAQTGQLLTRLTDDVEQIRRFINGGVIQCIAAIIMLCGSAVFLLMLNWRMALIALTTIPVILFLLLRMVQRVSPLYVQAQQKLDHLNTILREDLVGTRVIRAFLREAYENARYGRANGELLDKNLATVRAVSQTFPLVIFCSNLGTLAVLWYGGSEVITGRLSIGELVAFNVYLTLLIFPVLNIGFLAATISQAGASSLRVLEILEAPLGVEDAEDAKPLPRFTDKIEFRDVRFRYLESEKEILCGVSFTVKAGQSVALVGATGSGKSTIINLLPRFYDATSGSVSIDGQDLRNVTLDSLRGQIGIALQETLLFSGTVREQISFGKPTATQEEVEAAAVAAQADSFIRELPQGYDTVIGERGLGLSGGQRQRIAIARALLIEPSILLLDESTSAVDAATESAIREALKEAVRRRSSTVFVIARRPATLRKADLILVLDDGRIVAQGRHAELMRESVLYKELVGAHMEGEADSTPDGFLRELSAALPEHAYEGNES